MVPDLKSHRPEHTICVSCQQMAAWVEVAMDECVSGQEVLGLFGRFEPLHLPLPTPCRSSPEWDLAAQVAISLLLVFKGRADT